MPTSAVCFSIVLCVSWSSQDYPRTLAVSLAAHDVSAVFPAGQNRHEFWSLGTDHEQYLTDEFAIIHRDDFEAASLDKPPSSYTQKPIRLASEAIVVRIYRLWKDSK